MRGLTRGLLAIAGVVSIYSVWDMFQYNRARRAEWVEAQKKFEADELATARLAYLKGEATEEQILLVEEANREAEAQGIKLPPLLGAPEHRTHFEEHVKPAFSGRPDSSSSSTGTVAQSIEDKAKLAWEAEKHNQRTGGTLDQLGLDGQAQSKDTTKKGWWPW